MKKLLVIIFTFCLLLTINGCGEKEKASNLPMAYVEKIENGNALIKKAKSTEFVVVKVNNELFEGDTIRTEDKTEVLLRFSTGAVTRIMSNSDFELKERKLAKAEHTTVYTRLIKGIAYFYVPKGSSGAKKFEVETSRAIASIKGTKFKLEANDELITLSVAEGLVNFLDKISKKSVDVGKMQSADVSVKGLNGPYVSNSIADSNFSNEKLTILQTVGK